MTDVAAITPNLNLDMVIAAPRSEEKRVNRHLNRPTFQETLDTSDASLNHITFEEIDTKYELITER